MSQETTSSVGLYRCSRPAGAMRDAITAGRVPVAVYGLGKMGLPLAAVFARLTENTVGVDVNPAVVDSVNAGRCHVDREPGLPEAVANQVETGGLEATTDAAAAAARGRVHVIIVPTLVEDGVPDLSNLRAVTDAVAAGLTPGDLVCIESTVPPGTARDVVEPVLVEQSECRADEFGVAVCPERTASGRALRDITGAYPKVVGGTDEEATAVAALLYDQVTSNDVQTVTDATTAECVKVFEGVYRDVNIALANELARLGTEVGVDVREAITTANGQPYCDIHTPGPGVGGHCIPNYPYFLIEPLSTATPLVRTARWVNDAMPAYTVHRLVSALSDHGVDASSATVGVFGVAYRPGVDETSHSPGLEIARLLDTVGASVSVVDPVVDLSDVAYRSVSLEEVQECSFDAAVYATDHPEFEGLPWPEFVEAVVLDSRDSVSDDSSLDVRTIANPDG